jgi:hypothetical protein
MADEEKVTVIDDGARVLKPSLCANGQLVVPVRL